jgi:hypothetical protein
MVKPEQLKNRDQESSAVTTAMVVQSLRSDYAKCGKDTAVKALDGIQQLVEHLMNPQLELQTTLDFITRLIYKQLSIKEVSIGLRSPADSLYRYYSMYGLSAKSWETHKTLRYTRDELFDPSKYKGSALSKRSLLFLAEDKPYDDDELKTYSSFIAGMQKRTSPDGYLEGDYIDVLMHDRKNEIIGWIEVTGTWEGRLPDGGTIRALEAIASILSLVAPRLLGEAKA